MERGKKFLGVLILGIFLISFLSGFVSAQPKSAVGKEITNFIDEAVRVLNPIFKYLIGDASEGKFFFARILFLLIIFSIVWMVLNEIELFSDNAWILWIVSIAVSIIATRQLVNDVILETILLPYTTLGVVLSAGLPFVIYFIIVEVGLKGPSHKTIRKIAWIFFAVVFAGLYATRTAVPKDLSWVYPITAIVSLVMLFLDGTIQGMLRKMKIEKAGAASMDEAAINIRKKLTDINEMIEKNVITDSEARKLKKKYKKQLASLYK